MAEPDERPRGDDDIVDADFEDLDDDKRALSAPRNTEGRSDLPGRPSRSRRTTSMAKRDYYEMLGVQRGIG